MSATSRSNLEKVLAFAAIAEVGTAFVLVFDPAIVVTLLLGVDVAGMGIVLGRCFGVALLALGVACWPSGQSGESRSAAFRGMLTYNVLIALYLGFLGTARHLGGVLLWPAVALHAAVALSLVWAWRNARRANVPGK